MGKHGYAALLVLACGALSPMAHAGQFFVAGQFGEATYDDFERGEDSADTRAFSLGYRWQAGPYVQVGIEAGTGRIDAVSEVQQTAFNLYESRAETRYDHIGANARFAFGPDSRWFAIARAGYVDARVDVVESDEDRFTQPPLRTSHSYRLDADGAYFGAGVGVDVTKYLSVNVMAHGYAYSDYEGYTDGLGTVSATTLGVELRF